MVSFTYENLVDLIRNIANSVNPTGTFVHARRSDGSLEYDGAMPQIHLYPFTLRGTDTKETDLLIAFWQQDSPASSNEEREAIIQEMDVLSRTFMATLDDYETLEILGFNGEPQYRQLSGTLSGYAVRFTIRGGIACVDTPLPVPPSCPTLCERISDATAAEIDHCLSDEQVEDLSELICGTGTAQLNNSLGTLISNTSVTPNTTVPITAPDATAVIKNTLGTVLDTEAIPSNVSEDIVMPDVNNVDSDSSIVPTPAGVPFVCTPQQSLTVNFSANDTTPETNQTVTFTDLTVGATKWMWDFGDNESSDLQNPTHEYKYAGTYTVTLHADNGTIGGYEEKVGYIVVTLQTLFQTNLQMWNKAPTGAAPSNMTLVAGAVSQWNDEINGYNRTQGTAASRPTYNSTGYTAPDGTVYGTVEYDGVLGSMKNNSAGLTRAAGSYEVILLRIRTSANGTRVYFEAGNASLYESYLLVSGGVIYSALVCYQSAASSAQSAGIIADEWVLVKIHWNGASSSVQIDNLTKTVITNNLGTGAAQGSTQGATQAGTNRGKVDILEHAIYSAKPSDADVTAYIDNYFNSKFGLWE